MKTSNNGYPWTVQDDRTLRSSAKRGESSREAAVILKRTHGAVKYRAMVKKIRFHSINQPIGVQSRIQRRRFRKVKRG